MSAADQAISAFLRAARDPAGVDWPDVYRLKAEAFALVALAFDEQGDADSAGEARQAAQEARQAARALFSA